MEDIIIKQLSPDLQCDDYHIRDKRIIFNISSNKKSLPCPYCGTPSSKVHSTYERELQDIPLHDKQTILLLLTRKFFCPNTDCSHKTFSERFDFAPPREKRTTRLTEKILVTSVGISSINAEKTLRLDHVRTSKSTINELLKKNAGDCG